MRYCAVIGKLPKCGARNITRYYKMCSGQHTTEKQQGINMVNEETAKNLLDKIIVQQLHLMEDKMRCELNIESSINNACIHLAKSRYIMGQSSVSTTRLPTESSPDFSASTTCITVEEDGVKQLKVLDNNSEDTVNPLRWFGVLVPQNLHKAQNIFQNAINYVVECANVQLQIQENMKHIQIIKSYLNSLNSS